MHGVPHCMASLQTSPHASDFDGRASTRAVEKTDDISSGGICELY